MTKFTTIPTLNMPRDEWLEHRKDGIGGSDSGIVMGYSEWNSPMELFYQKLGLFPIGKDDNEAMHWGRAMEDLVADRWQYWGGTKESYLENYTEGKKVRKCRKKNAIVINPKYPWLRANIDREFSGGVLECKTISGWYAKQWEGELPKIYYYQLQQYMLIMERDYGEIAILQDGRFFDVLPIEADSEEQQKIIEQTKGFWDKVQEAKDILNNVVWHTEEEAINLVQHLDPDPIGTDADIKFLDLLHKSSSQEKVVIYPTEEIEDFAQQHKEMLAKQKEMEKEAKLYRTRLQEVMVEYGADTIDFGDRGKLTWKNNGFRNNVKF